MLTTFATRWHTTSDSIKSFESNIERTMLGWWALLSRASFNSTVLIPHRQLKNYLLSPGESYGLAANISVRHYIHQCLTSWLLTEAQDSTLQEILVPICINDICWKTVFQNYGPVTSLQDGHQGNASHRVYQHHSTSEITLWHMGLHNT